MKKEDGSFLCLKCVRKQTDLILILFSKFLVLFLFIESGIEPISSQLAKLCRKVPVYDLNDNI